MKLENIKLLISRLEKQLDSPEAARFNMAYFGNPYNLAQSGVLQIVKDNPPVCKTQACLAGETLLATGKGFIQPDGGIGITGKTFTWTSEIPDVATQELGLTIAQANKLFYFKSWKHGKYGEGRYHGWPVKFEVMYTDAVTPQGRLYAAIRRIEHFIKTKGRE